MRQEVARLVHHVDPQVRILDADVDVHAEDEQALRQIGHLFELLDVALLDGDVLSAPHREGVRAGRRDRQAILVRYVAGRRAQADELGARLPHVLADLRADLDLRLHQLRLDLVVEDHPALIEELLDVRGQLPGLGIDDLVLLLDADGVSGLGHSPSRRAHANCPGSGGV